MRLRHGTDHKFQSFGCGPEPVSAFTLATLEAQRRDLVKNMGPCRTGCQELDDDVLLGGGLERGCVVGISAEDEDGFGMVFVCQVVSNALLENGSGGAVSALFITPKPASVVLAPLSNSITAALTAGGKLGPQDMAKKRNECLDRIMLSCVFDVNGLCEVLADLDKPGKEKDKRLANPRDEDNAPVSSPSTGQGHIIGSGSSTQSLLTTMKSSPPVIAIRDSQDDAEEVENLEQEGQSVASKNVTRSEAVSKKTATRRDDDHDHDKPKSPDIIIVTHFSSILTSLFTQREKPTAHSMTQIVACRLRHLSRTLASHPLIILLNSTDSIHTNVEIQTGSCPMPFFSSSHNASDEAARIKAIDPTLRSIFLPSPSSSLASPSSDGRSHQIHMTIRPSFGLIFSQLLDLHLLCTRVARTRPVAEKTSISASALSQRYVTIVEVLIDELGLWEGNRGKRKSREQRWAALDVAGTRIVHALDLRDGRGS